ncbi:MAG TPA: DUF4870 domain-containing protein [Streptosporangiaceae bacterium]|nr:DUF4870 domain-containing protein [Streptosporangiaceae bacterium]
MGLRSGHPRRTRAHAAAASAAIGRGTIAVSIPARSSPPVPGPAGPGPRARTAAAASYLSAGLLGFVPPLVVYVISRRKDSPYVKVHAAQALNTAITMAVYAVCSAIVGALLALDSLQLGIQIAITCGLFAWLVTSGYLVSASIAASRGRHYHIPAYLCAELV